MVWTAVSRGLVLGEGGIDVDSLVRLRGRTKTTVSYQRMDILGAKMYIP